MSRACIRLDDYEERERRAEKLKAAFSSEVFTGDKKQLVEDAKRLKTISLFSCNDYVKQDDLDSFKSIIDKYDITCHDRVIDWDNCLYLATELSNHRFVDYIINECRFGRGNMRYILNAANNYKGDIRVFDILIKACVEDGSKQISSILLEIIGAGEIDLVNYLVEEYKPEITKQEWESCHVNRNPYFCQQERYKCIFSYVLTNCVK